jgi:hypothetical protein
MSRARTQPIDLYMKRTSFSFAGMRKMEGIFLTLQRNNVLDFEREDTCFTRSGRRGGCMRPLDQAINLFCGISLEIPFKYQDKMINLFESVILKSDKISEVQIFPDTQEHQTNKTRFGSSHSSLLLVLLKN